MNSSEDKEPLLSQDKVIDIAEKDKQESAPVQVILIKIICMLKKFIIYTFW